MFDWPSAPVVPAESTAASTSQPAHRAVPAVREVPGALNQIMFQPAGSRIPQGKSTGIEA